jgi:hypothetical protein
VQDRIELPLARFAEGNLMQSGSQIKLGHGDRCCCQVNPAMLHASNLPLRHAAVESIRSTWTGYRMATSIQRMFFSPEGPLRIVAFYDKLAGTFVVASFRLWRDHGRDYAAPTTS